MENSKCNSSYYFPVCTVFGRQGRQEQERREKLKLRFSQRSLGEFDEARTEISAFVIL